MFSIKFNTRSHKTLQKYPRNISKRILKKISDLRTNPVPNYVKKIINVRSKMYRIRVGDYRVLYIVNYENKEIYISNIDKRSRIY